MILQEEVYKYQELLKLARNLDKNALIELFSRYEIKDNGNCGEYIFKGIV